MTDAAAETISVGIVTHNHGALIGGTLQHLLRSLPRGVETRIWVLDNASTDDSVAVARSVAADDRRVEVIASKTNEGFGRGHNRILGLTDATFHVFFNPDVTIGEGVFEGLMSFFRRYPDAAMVCPRIHHEDGRLQTLNRRHPTVLDLFVSRFVREKFGGLATARIGHYRMEDIGYERACEVPFMSGAFMFCRTQPLKAAGGFDSRYFLYFEDADLSRTVQALGWKTLYCPDVTVVHRWQRSTHHSYRHMMYFCVSAYRYFNKWGWRLW